MSSRDWFMLAARVFSLWILFVGVTYLASYIEFCLGFRHDADLSKGQLVQGCAMICLAYYFLLGTKHLARLTYGQENPGSGADATTATNEPTSIQEHSN